MSKLQRELWELFDLKLRKERREGHLAQEVSEAMKDINRLSLMFQEEVEERLTIPVGDGEALIWDGNLRRILYSKDGRPRLIETTENETIIRLRPFLNRLVELAMEA